MTDAIKTANDKLRGFRGLLLILATWAGMYLDSAFNALSGLSPEAVKAAFIGSIPITVKLVWTDAKPRLMELIKGAPAVVMAVAVAFMLAPPAPAIAGGNHYTSPAPTNPTTTQTPTTNETSSGHSDGRGFFIVAALIAIVAAIVCLFTDECKSTKATAPPAPAGNSGSMVPDNANPSQHPVIIRGTVQ